MSTSEAREADPSPPAIYKRKTKFIRKDLQLKIIFGTLFIALFVSVFSLQVPFLGLWVLQEVSPQSVESVYSLFSKLLLISLGVSLLLTVPLSAWMGVAFSFHFCGPIHRIKLYFEEVANGRWDPELHLRKTDDLQDVKDIINKFMDGARKRVGGQAGLLESTRILLSRCQTGRIDPDEAAALVRKIETELAACDSEACEVSSVEHEEAGIPA